MTVSRETKNIKTPFTVVFLSVGLRAKKITTQGDSKEPIGIPIDKWEVKAISPQ